MKRALLLAAVALLALLASGVVLAQGGGPAAPPAPAIAPKHFDHGAHAKRAVDVTRCERCHRVDPTGKLLAPAAQGHAPCLEAKCHASDFLAVGTSEKTRPAPADPKFPKFQQAAAFCLGCHEKVPWPWKQATTRVVPSFAGGREYHVEMNHFAHAARAGDHGNGCRGCHVVDGKSFALVVGTPGHAQCQTCHNPKDNPEHTMGQCGHCHQPPSRDAYVQQQLAARGAKRGSRPSTNVRACGGEVHTRLAAKNPNVPCFKHERVEHRTETGTPDGAPLQCAKCHYVVADKTKGAQYQSLVDLRVRPIIDNDRDRQHASCGRVGCHQRQVKAETCAESFCHADLSVF